MAWADLAHEIGEEFAALSPPMGDVLQAALYAKYKVKVARDTERYRLDHARAAERREYRRRFMRVKRGKCPRCLAPKRARSPYCSDQCRKADYYAKRTKGR